MTPDSDDDLIPAASGSPLAGFRAAREAAAAKLHLDLRVARYDDPEVWVRYSPANVGRAERAEATRRKSKDPDWLVLANADVLVDACVGVFAVLDGKRYALDPEHPDGEWPRFDDRLAAALGVGATKAVDVCRALFLTDGDLVSHAAELARWSGMAALDAENAAAGE